MLSGDRDIEDIQGVPRKKFPMLKMSLDMGFYYFKPNFLSPPWSKMKNFSSNQKEDELRISKIPLLLFLVPFLGELWPLKHGDNFYGHPVLYHAHLFPKHSRIHSANTREGECDCVTDALTDLMPRLSQNNGIANK